jgi:hypothetical protein
LHSTGVQLLNLMFRPGETICVSPNQFAYHSMPLENAMSDKVTLLSPNPKVPIEYVHSDQLLFVALNPIEGFRNDINCKAYRNFLIEMDIGPLKDQMDYIKEIEMPYSACVFSGGKSLHFLISLDTDLPNAEIYRKFAVWTLSIATLSDQNCQNPSRSIRVPGAEREPGKFQRLVEIKGPVKLSDFAAWLGRYPHLKPKEKEKRPRSENADFDRLKPWVVQRLQSGLDPTKGRNKQWFSIACEFALAGYNEDDTIEILSGFFNEERDFKEREWLTALRSGFKYIYDRNGS